MGQRGSACAWGDVRARERKRDREREAHERGRERGGGGQEERKTGLVSRPTLQDRERGILEERKRQRASERAPVCMYSVRVYVCSARAQAHTYSLCHLVCV
jgi:hypothetical protein